jgi:hypothetical protein
VSKALEGVSVGGFAQARAEAAETGIARTGVDDVTVEEQAVPHPVGEFVPFEVGEVALQLVKGLHPWPDGVVVAEDDDEPALGVREAKVLKEVACGKHGAAEDAMTRPLEVENIPIQDEDLDFGGGALDLPEVAPVVRVMTEQVKIGNRGSPRHDSKLHKLLRNDNNRTT